MPANPTLSIILCTRDRAASLAGTLKSLGKVHVPTGWQVDVTVVDNGSSDGTAEVVRGSGPTPWPLRYVFEPRKGLSRARNAGLAATRGDIVLFTDDDVEVSPRWLQQMAEPILDGRSVATTGNIRLAAHLAKPWMTAMHKMWLASSDAFVSQDAAPELIGANMAFRRSVLQSVPGFDTELGAGALGMAEETLFGWQLTEAGQKIDFVPDATVVHHLEEARLRRKCWLAAAVQRGRTHAYLRYHWHHTDIAVPRLVGLSFRLRLHARRLLQPPPALEAEGCPAWEMSYILNAEMCRQFCIEKRRPRNYARHGLTKQTAAD